MIIYVYGTVEEYFFFFRWSRHVHDISWQYTTSSQRDSQSRQIPVLGFRLLHGSIQVFGTNPPVEKKQLIAGPSFF